MTEGVVLLACHGVGSRLLVEQETHEHIVVAAASLALSLTICPYSCSTLVAFRDGILVRRVTTSTCHTINLPGVLTCCTLLVSCILCSRLGSIDRRR